MQPDVGALLKVVGNAEWCFVAYRSGAGRDTLGQRGAETIDHNPHIEINRAALEQVGNSFGVVVTAEDLLAQLYLRQALRA